MSRSRSDVFDPIDDLDEPTGCVRFFRLLWKFSRCVFSHITLVSLVVAYCVIGAYAFESLEAEHEREVKRSIKGIREKITDELWKVTNEIRTRENWTEKALSELQGFETKLTWMMKKEGWDGIEEEEQIQWTFMGALFYSIIVITTIGYGHIAPKTKNGKIVTIFYAILGIPLMLLCLSNIGDVMASSFRFLYWKVCCYVCTKPPKRRRARNFLARSYSMRQPGRYGGSRGPPFLRRSIRTSQRSADSALGLSESIARSVYSDTDFRYNARRFNGLDNRRASSYVPPMGTSSRYFDQPTFTPRTTRGNARLMTQSLDRRLFVSLNSTDRSPVLCNKYALDNFEHELHEWQQRSTATDDPSKTRNVGETVVDTNVVQKSRPFVARSLPRRCLSVESASTNHRSNEMPSLRPTSAYLEVDSARRYQTPAARRCRANYSVARTRRRETPSPRIMSPLGYPVHRRYPASDFDYDYNYYVTNDDGERQPIKPVPIWLCVFLVVSYIFGGAFLFSGWESWTFLDSAYFCFITLTTIGFGDFVPEHRLNAHTGIALCSLYLLFGISLLAMSFNLVQEEVINTVKNVAKRLGIIKDSDDDEDDDEEEEYDDCELEYNDEIDEFA